MELGIIVGIVAITALEVPLILILDILKPLNVKIALINAFKKIYFDYDFIKKLN